ncbi:MAG: hypothetical protein JRI68_03680 [Deltaproteobacteria bacterium]|nr:hypothetical protein [Deltaproteobacteria bacterium]
MIRLGKVLVIATLPLLFGCGGKATVDVPLATGSGGTGGQAGGGGAGANGGEGGGTSCTDVLLSFTETDLDHAVPAGVSYLHAKAWGGGGNQECFNDTGFGGVGGFTEAIFPVTPGTPLIVIVGGRKLIDPLSPEEQVTLGFPGQGAGGLSGLFEGPGPIDDGDRDRALIIAGGGGGAGALAQNCSHGHPGNHPTMAGGQPTMLGQAGNIMVNSGGGGYEGGKGGVTDMDPGWGGTGFVQDSALASILESSETGAFDPPAVTDPDYDGEAGMQERPGLVVLSYLCDGPPPL